MSEKSNRNIFELIAKSFANEASESEKKSLNEELESSDENKSKLEKAHYIWSNIEFSDSKKQLVSQQEANDKIWHATFGKEEKSMYKFRDAVFILKIAATFLIIALVPFSIYSLISSQEKASPEITAITKQTLPGQKSTITLQDGSVAWLNSGSSITYYSNYNEEERLIELKGQAYFEVFKDRERPFIVKCDDLGVEALGTSFDVKAYENNEIQVSLLTGKVSVQFTDDPGNTQMILMPGEYSKINYETRVIDKGLFNEIEVLAWKEGRLIFEESTIAEIVPILELWFGVTFDNQISTHISKRYNSTFEKENLNNILMNISEVMNIDYEINGNEVVLKNKLPM